MKIKLGKKGAALMQVLLITVILAGLATMLLRMGLSRTSSARRTRRLINVQTLIESCMAEVNMTWAAKTPEAFTRDFRGIRAGPVMYCDTLNANGTCKSTVNYYNCTPVTVTQEDGSTVTYQVRAYLNSTSYTTTPTQFDIAYEVMVGNQNL